MLIHDFYGMFAMGAPHSCGSQFDPVGVQLFKVLYISIVCRTHERSYCWVTERGQIKGGILDGPLAFDNAISREAALTKGIVSPVAGDADILLVPDLEAGNMLAKELTFLANADAAGIVLGARVPVILTSRADSVRARLASCAVAAIYSHARSILAAGLAAE